MIIWILNSKKYWKAIENVRVVGNTVCYTNNFLQRDNFSNEKLIFHLKKEFFIGTRKTTFQTKNLLYFCEKGWGGSCQMCFEYGYIIFYAKKLNQLIFKRALFVLLSWSSQHSTCCLILFSSSLAKPNFKL